MNLELKKSWWVNGLRSRWGTSEWDGGIGGRGGRLRVGIKLRVRVRAKITVKERLMILQQRRIQKWNWSNISNTT